MNTQETLPRSAEAHLAQWLARPGRKPLVIRGARQVGKSTLVRRFAAQSSLRLYEVNLERYPGLNEVFATYDTARILRELDLATGQGRPDADATLLFLDEVQATPQALAALRYLHEERPGLLVIAAGSLLEFTLRDHRFSMPVGRIEYCHLGPLTFEEFLDSLGEQSLLQYVRSVTVADPSDAAHERLLGLLRDYLLVGGMPEAVAAHARGDDMAACAAIHRSVVDTVRDDFAKYATDSRLMQLRRVYDFIPTAVGAKFRYVQVEPHSPSREVREAMDLLCLAGVAYRVHHTDATGVPLGAVADTRVFKALALDVGLMHTQCGLAAYSLQDMRSAALVNEGGVAEQFVGQQLLRSEPFDVHPQVWYWLREARSANAEVDYVLQHSSAVVPLEVKAGARGSLRSLHLFCSLKKCTVALRFDQNQISLQQVEQQVRNGDTHATAAYRLLSLPLYLAGQVRRFLDAHL